MKSLILFVSFLVLFCGCATAQKNGETEPVKKETAAEPEKSPEDGVKPEETKEEPNPFESKVPAKKTVEGVEAALEREKAAMRAFQEAYQYFLANEYEDKEDLIPHFQAVVDKYPGTEGAKMALEEIRKLHERAR